MESHSYDSDLAVALTALRPTPRPEFAAELDARVAEGFPRRRRAAAAGGGPLARLRALPRRRILLPAGGFAVAAVVVATAVIAVSEDGGLDTHPGAPRSATPSAGGKATTAPGHPRYSSSLPSAHAESAAAAATSTDSGATEFEAAPPTANGVRTANGPYASHVRGRDVERGAQIVLGAEPADIRDDAVQVFEAVHAANGIVLSSSIRDGAAGAGGARFELLIPAAKLGDAMASFSAIADVVSRHESTADITAPTIGVAERRQDSRARVNGLLAQLADADSDAEREAVEAELHTERNRQAALRSRLTTLNRHANLSHVSLRIETGKHAAAAAESSGGGWGVGDGFDDAGRILAIAAGVTVIGLAILAPLTALFLLAWRARRAWLRRTRHVALERA